MPPRSPLWNLFTTDNQPYSAKDTVHKRIWCQACLEAKLTGLLANQRVLVANGVIRPEDMLKEDVLQQKAKVDVKPISSKSEHMQRHLKSCQAIRQSPEWTEKTLEALRSYETWRSKRTPLVDIPLSQPSLQHFSGTGVPSNPMFQAVSPFTPTAYVSEPPNSPLTKRRKSNTDHISTADSPLGALSVWDAEQQSEFGQDLVRLFTSCNWSWNTANAPQFWLFFGKYLPQAQVPDLSGRMLDSEAERVQEQTRKSIEGSLATYQADG
ncbi:hypothetical protein E1B28_006756 [Marasmius oreades]|uniref:Uncharacterized protein n=1 Tax=Marasmius oreades TaxID=181124 RepID=A0A9P8ABD0_9AGAR|nr:uncharacterized protein E1B28_006756 [Marasmius oreades]KAG7096075.1 hypothetical protein E1B28_006756 [Marasmius oreades]